MMFLCATRFDLEEERGELLSEFFTRDEIEAMKEERDEKPDDIDIDPISDTEEQDLTEEAYLVERDREDSEPCLPSEATQVRVSARKRTRREDDGFEYH
jgi:hypothetical protein